MVHETGISQETAAQLVQLVQAIRRAEGAGLREVASTRVLIAAGRLAAGGLQPRDAARAAAAGPLTDDPLLTAGLIEMIDAYLADGPADIPPPKEDRGPGPGGEKRPPISAESLAPDACVRLCSEKPDTSVR